MRDSSSTAILSEQEAAHHGIITDKQRLLRSRHWASRLNIFSKRVASSMLLGNTRSRFRGRGMEFEEVRRYQPGDDIRTIDWKVSARNPGTFTKLFCEERERPCFIIIDQRSSLFFGSNERFKSVLAAELGTALAWAALSMGDRVGAQIIGDTSEVDIRARNSRKALMTLIDHVHQLNSSLLSSALSNNQSMSNDNKAASNPLSYYLDECLRIIRPGSAVFIISDFHDIDAECTKALSKISKRADTTLLQVFDPLEKALPKGTLGISDGDEIAKVKVNNALHSAYERTLAEQELLLRNAATKSNAYLIKISTAITARDALTQVYR